MNTIIGKIIKNLRLKNGMTLYSFWSEYKVGTAAASYYENGKRQIPIEYLPLIAERFNISIDELFGKKTTIIVKEYDSSKDTSSIPLVGNVAAGLLSYSERDIEIENLKLDKKLLPQQKDIFDGKPRLMAFCVEGDSMEPDIKSNDYVVIDRNLTINEIHDHDIVIAKEKKDIKYTLKKFFKPHNINDTVVLLPGNPKNVPIPLKAKEIEIIGKIVLIIKKA